MDLLAGFAMGALFALFMAGNCVPAWPSAIIAGTAALATIVVLIADKGEEENRPYDWERDGL